MYYTTEDWKGLGPPSTLAVARSEWEMRAVEKEAQPRSRFAKVDAPPEDRGSPLPEVIAGCITVAFAEYRRTCNSLSQ